MSSANTHSYTRCPPKLPSLYVHNCLSSYHSMGHDPCSLWTTASNLFNKVHGACVLPELNLGQEVLFRSPADGEYIYGTIIDRATELHSYIIAAQGRRYRWNREHMQPIHLNLPPPACHPLPLHPTTSCIPKHNPLSKHTPHKPLPGPSSKPPATFCILPTLYPLQRMLHLQSKTSFNTCLSSTPSPVLVPHPRNLAHPQVLNWHWPQLSHWRSWKLRTLPCNVTLPWSLTASPSLWRAKCPLPHTCCDPGYP